jgi:catechol 2,3-dioxygenase-like lactoylglutathione lyase family enzyme
MTDMSGSGTERGARPTNPPELFHTGIVVPDLERAMTRFEEAFGLEFLEPRHNPGTARVDAGIFAAETLLTLSTNDGHRIELIQQLDAPAYDRLPTRTHHLGFWSADLPGHMAQLDRAGFESRLVGVDPSDGPDFFSFHFDADTGLWMELLSTDRSPAFAEWLASGARTPRRDGGAP